MVIAIKLGEEKLKLNLNFCKNETNTITEQEKECIKNYIEKDNQELYENKFGENVTESSPLPELLSHNHCGVGHKQILGLIILYSSSVAPFCP